MKNVNTHDLVGEGFEELAREIVEALPAHIAVLDNHGNIIAVNRPYRQFAVENDGDEETIRGIGTNYLASIRKEGFADAQSALAALSGLSDVLSGSSPSFQLTYPCDAPDEPRWFLMNVVKLSESNERVLVSHTNITEHKRAETVLQNANRELAKQVETRSEELNRFFSVADDMLCILDSDGCFLRLNPAFTANLGWSEMELLSRRCYELLHPDDVAATRQRLERSSEVRSSPGFENRCRRKDGSLITVAWRSVKTQDGLIYATGRDVTEQREMESKVRASSEAAQRANAAKNDFLSRMSHELRTPLNAVLGYAQLLDLKYEDPEIREATHAIMKSGKHLLQLINEVLDLSRIESGNLGMSLEPVALAALMSEAFNILGQTSEEGGVQLGPIADCGEIYVQADKQRLLQVLLNILGNAIKYNHPGGSVSVRCIVGEDSCRVEISDTGPGIDPDSRGLLFQPFQRFSAPGIDGTGLGLALSERFVRLMGGTIGLADSSPEGSTFYVELKKTLAPEKQLVLPNEASPHSASGLSRGTVLYIEDNLSNIQLIRTILNDWKHIELISATDGRLGLELASHHQPHLILLDVHLPDLAGDGVLAELKANFRNEAYTCCHAKC